MSPRLAHSVATNYLALAVQAGTLLVLTPVLLKTRDASLLGGWTICQAVAGYVRLLDLGVGPTVARFVAATRDRREQRAIAATATALMLVGFTLATALGLILNSQAGHLAYGIPQLGPALLVASIAAGVQLPLRISSHVLFGLERIPERNAFAIARALASLTGGLAAVVAGGDLLAIVAGSAAGEVLVSLGQVWHTKHRVGISLFGRPRRRLVPSLVRFGSGVLGLTAATQIVLYSDSIVLGVASGAAAVGVYAVAARAVEGASLVLSQTVDVFLPRLTRLQTEHDPVAARRIVRLGVLLSIVLALPILAILIGCADAVVRLWVGDAGADAVVPLALLAAALACNVPLRFPVLWALSTGKHRGIAFVAVAEAIVNVALSVALVGPLGAEGVALATLISVGISNGAVIPAFAVRASGLRLWRDYALPVLTAVVLLAPLTVAEAVLIPSLAPAVGLAVGLAVAVFHVALLGRALLDASTRRAVRARASVRRFSPGARNARGGSPTIQP